MPHVVVKMYKGRSEEQKQALTRRVSEALIETVGCSDDHISVAIEEYDRKEWGEKVFYPEIMANMDSLYKKPNYKPE
ncbi:MAG: 2-hydroxymuconate tautomerase [Firmicutes bacterium ADurb.Bin193]|nr:MAG: 2-hydroxymuconate tautomerase [Firmicutes bacterium ADurb.Bin193]